MGKANCLTPAVSEWANVDHQLCVNFPDQFAFGVPSECAIGPGLDRRGQKGVGEWINSVERNAPTFCVSSHGQGCNAPF